MSNPESEHSQQSSSSEDYEAQFWQRMSELGVPDGEAWEALLVTLAEIEGGAEHRDPWKVTAERLAQRSR
ncbi:hypothetical protein [Saccharopolyspora rectivirgula]|uniref:Uncharacterized protein n=1 Tax=Saccharopolyspora rectivirgula TaxID=28042 RepID=A0A073B7I6_9PSEU|nr:hypothetical protein [Saccharopolyspora rectivirgula]KEI43619.1 hypothetical protein GU90_14900 [Saccharopolyspora rectivirgula]